MITVVLPWPDKRLSPNSRTHWATKAKAAKGARKTAEMLCRMAMASANWAAPLLPKVGVTFHPADKRRRDLDNLIASMKSAHDGLADALYRNDANFTLSFKIGAVLKPACVVVEIS